VTGIVLQTERMFLRRFSTDDLAVLCEWHLDPAFMRYLVGGLRESREQVAADLEAYVAHEQEHGFGKWIVQHRETGNPMGRAGLVHLPSTDEIDLGYAFAKPFWGQGYATEVASALVRHADGLGLFSRLIGLAHPDNHPSFRVLEKVGFRFTGMGDYFQASYRVYRPRSAS
jgi:RimJ/RimL family protein N-acetyltransferase